MRVLEVALGERAYPIHIGSGLLHRAGALLEATLGSRVIVVTNPTVAALHLDALKEGLAERVKVIDVLKVPDGESHKGWPALQDLMTRMLELRAERSTVVVALGGGVVGDLAGFAASIYQRGVPLVQIPTTLLSQVDSSVGGKTGINHPLGKNMIGAFWQPRAVLIDTDCLGTLPERELKAGIAEVIKYGAIRDPAFFAWLEENAALLLGRDAPALAHAIFESCRIKADFVTADERESGDRALLNFGHTLGHAIETGSGYGTWLHGEAVAAGMVVATRISERVCGLATQDSQRIRDLIGASGLPTRPPPLGVDRWLDLMGRDKKVSEGRIRYILLDRLGHAIVRSDVSRDDLAFALAA